MPMSERAADQGGSRFEVRVTSDSHFSWIRTRLSVERTLMSWVRTATALIGFGFTIVTFFEHLSAMQGVAPALRPQLPRYVGLALIAAGVVALAVSLWQYRMVIGYLWSDQFHPIAGMREGGTQTPLLFVTGMLIIIGVLTFGAIFLRAV